jgi:hypothetical protein
VPRYEQLQAFAQEHGFDAEAAFFGKSIDALR